MHSTRALTVAFLSAFITLNCAGNSEPDPDPVWYRALNLSVPSNPRFEAFEIVGVGSEPGNHIFGRFFYFNYKPEEKSPPPVTISGSRKKTDGTFWPRVTAQVAKDAKGPWTTIRVPPAPGEATSLSVVSKPDEERFYVNLDIFRPMIGKMDYGRVVLETGEVAAFGLDNLLPPKTDEELKRDSLNK